LFILGLGVFSALAGAAYYVVHTPLPAEVPQAQTTVLTDIEGHDLARLSGGENRVDVRIGQVPAVLVDAVVASEDRHFFNHGGVDPVGVVRALVADVEGHRLQGGSTITQQYVKNAFLSPKRTLGRKIKEAVLALKLERKYTKLQILERYLNTIYFGRGAYGVEAASKAYFGLDVGQLDLQQSAFLAGIISAPTAADPYRNPRLATERRNHVLDDLVSTHHLTRAAADAAKAVAVTSFVRPQATATTASVALTDVGSEYFVDYVTAELVRRYGEATALGGGLRVKTTLDPRMQAAAYQAAYDPSRGVLTDRVHDPSSAIVAVDTTGQVRVMVGGRGYGVSKVNLAVGTGGGGTGRQAGSTFKAFLLAEVLKENYSMLSSFPAPAEIIIPRANNGADYKVKNFDNESFPSDISLLDATKNSVNTVYAQVVDAIGPPHLVDMAHRLGVITPLPANVSLVLGTTEVSPLEMAGAYSTFMNRGVRRTPHVIDEVRDAAGKLLDKGGPQPVPAIDAAIADRVTYALQQVVLGGTGAGAKIGRPLAGKTGTTESSSDAWFIGYTPQLTAAVWMGYRDSKAPMVNIHGVKNVNGGSLPAEIFRRFMTAATAGLPVQDFVRVYYLGGQTLGRPPVTLVTSTTSTSTTSTSTTAPVTSTTVVSTSTTAGASPTTTKRSTTTTAKPRPANGPAP
jgi:penicillin-binding protein 1A